MPTISTFSSTLGPKPMRFASFDGAGELAVFDQMSVFEVEAEISGSDAHLTVGEAFRVDALLHGADDLLGIVGAVGHVGIAHSGDRRISKALPAAVAGGSCFCSVARRYGRACSSVKIPFSTSTVLLGLEALVIDVDGAALLGIVPSSMMVTKLGSDSFSRSGPRRRKSPCG